MSLLTAEPSSGLGWVVPWLHRPITTAQTAGHYQCKIVLAPFVCSDRRWIFIYYMPMKICFSDTLLCVFYFLSHQG